MFCPPRGAKKQYQLIDYYYFLKNKDGDFTRTFQMDQ